MTLDTITDPRNNAYQKGTCRETMAKALSCSAHAYFEKYYCPADHLSVMKAEEKEFERPEPPVNTMIGYLYLALQYADATSTRRGLVSPVALFIGFYIYRLGDQLKIDSTETPLLQDFTSLWQACQERQAEIFTEERSRPKKIKKTPNAYTCAAEGCGIKAAKAASFLACALQILNPIIAARIVKSRYVMIQILEFEWLY